MRRLLRRAAARLRGRGRLATWHHPEYRPPITTVEARTGWNPRRADLAAWYLVDHGVLRLRELRTPSLAPFAALARVHTPRLLESLTRSETLARIFALDASDLPVDEVLTTIRLGCGGTCDATRHALEAGGPALNLFGGFHHASPDKAAGFCAINDIAVALAAVRAEGFGGRAGVIDLDAHPPDGTADCLESDPSYWIGSLSGSDWGPLPTVDEVVLPARSGDLAYLSALEALLDRMPRLDLCFVVAGGDVLAGDRLGQLGLTLTGVRRRDLLVAKALGRTPSVWVPGGAYNPHGWRVLAGTALALSWGSERPIDRNVDPLAEHFAAVSKRLDQGALTDALINEEDIADQLGIHTSRRRSFLGFYSTAGIEHGLFEYGLLPHIERLGYSDLRIALDATPQGDRCRLFGRSSDGAEHVLLELVLEIRRIGDERLLFVHWLTLRNPRVQFTVRRPQLPGQDTPGLGLARECAELLGRIAHRLGLVGVAINPAWYHVAYSARYEMEFADPARQGRWLALVRDMSGVPLLEVTMAVSAGRVRLGDDVYVWEADEMVSRVDPHADPKARAAAIEAEAARCRFEIGSESP